MVYKYVGPQILEPVQKRTLRFSSAQYLNDPFECLPRLDNRDVLEEIERLKSETVFSILPESFWKQKAEDIDVNHNVIEQEAQAKLQSKMDSMGILALSRVRNSCLMWSHYAQNHEGYVLGFDDDSAFFKMKLTEDDIGVLKDVKYQIERHKLTRSEKGAALGDLEMFFVKSTDWGYEKEVRMIFPMEACSEVAPGLFVREYPTSALKEVVFGCRCGEETKSKIRKSLSGQEVSYFNAFPSSRHFDMLVEEIQ